MRSTKDETIFWVCALALSVAIAMLEMSIL